jgi:hypothetical protein
MKGDALELWKSRGEGAFPRAMAQETVGGSDFYFRTISVRGKTVGAVFAAPVFEAEPLDFLSASLERAIEAFGFRFRPPAPKQAV